MVAMFTSPPRQRNQGILIDISGNHSRISSDLLPALRTYDFHSYSRVNQKCFLHQDKSQWRYHQSLVGPLATFPSVAQLTIQTVFFFTTALFLAGYVLQQQTVRDIRAVIKPQLTRAPPNGPELFLPKQFRDDGYLVDVIVDPVLPPKDEQHASGTNIEIKDTQSEKSSGSEEAVGEESVEEEMIGATRWQKAARKKQLEALNAAKGNGNQSPMVDTETESSAEDGRGPKSEKQKEEEKLSRAARRKKIKDQILADGEGESFKGYRRRMW